jgi:hypothetical protein
LYVDEMKQKEMNLKGILKYLAVMKGRVMTSSNPESYVSFALLPAGSPNAERSRG